jgi:hypothetical protein
MNPIIFSKVGFTNWCIKTIIQQTFGPGCNEGGTIHRAEKISIPDQEKGG